jgi:hypothetical protein
MGVFRRHEPTAAEKAMQDRFTLGAAEAGATRETCWFCGEEVEVDDQGGELDDVAALTIEPIGPADSVYGFCHLACAERAKGSLAS